MTGPLTPDLDEALRRGAVVWIRPEGDERAYPVWYLWHQRCLWVVAGGDEQPLPMASRAEVIARDKDQPLVRAGSWPADVEPVLPGTPEWEAVVPLLHARRLNAPDGENQPVRWAATSTILRFTPRPATPG